MGTGGIPSNGATGASRRGLRSPTQTALNLTAFYACVRLLADSIASLPWDAYRKSGDVRREVPSSLLTAPNSGMTAFDWKHQLMVSLVMRGNFYGLVTQRDGLEYPTQIVPMHPDSVRIDRDPNTLEKRVWVGNDRYPLSDPFHIPAFRLPGSDVGLSPVAMARHSLGLGLAAQEYGAKWFGDGATPSSVLQTDSTLSREEARAVQQRWIASHGGRRLPAVLSGGLAWKPIQISPEESQFLQTRQHQGLEVAQMMGVPPHMIGIVDRSTSWGTASSSSRSGS